MQFKDTIVPQLSMTFRNIRKQNLVTDQRIQTSDYIRKEGAEVL